MTRAAIILAATLFSAPAAAHAFLEHASPPAGARLATAPGRIHLEFSEALAGAFSGVSVTDAGSHDVTRGKAMVRGESMDVDLRPLQPGTYHVRWHAQSLDAHRTQGAYEFQVGR